MKQRYAAIDIGTNSVKLWVADASGEGFPDTVYEDIQITRLGEDQSRGDPLTDEAMERTLKTAGHFEDIARQNNARKVVIAATSAVRQAANRDEFLRQAQDILQNDLRVISGDDEASFTFSGVTYGRTDAHDRVSVFDVGGGSTEFMYGQNTKNTFRKSVPIGSVQLTEGRGWDGALTTDDFEAGIRYCADVIKDHIPGKRLAECSASDHVIGVGGTVATITQVHLDLPEFVRSEIEGCQISRSDLQTTCERIVRCSPDERVEQLHVKPGRRHYITGGAAVVLGVMQTLSSTVMDATCRGLRHGLLIDTFIRSMSHT